MRGSPSSCIDFLDVRRIIPAHAGLTNRFGPGFYQSRDHPRACGAHCNAFDLVRIHKGSSPRMRGSPLRLIWLIPCGGIIPAHAGLTCLDRWFRNVAEDHPRACGAHGQYYGKAGVYGGSSPRMRGSLERDLQPIPSRGIIPAHAGLTKHYLCLLYTRRDHPRACGAHVCLTLPMSTAPGSSPRMRGSHPRELHLQADAGIIPAHAGLTAIGGGFSGLGGDHPRACGAHISVDFLDVPILGSSPRMRGSRDVRAEDCRAFGIIPAHAGLTRDVGRGLCVLWDHPRACGAHPHRRRRRAARQGSSPRMRGSQLLSPTFIASLGIIPAHAGLTPAACG